MAERWSSAESRSAAVFFRDSNGAPVSGLTPTAAVLHKDGSAGAPTGSVTGVGQGFYRVAFSSAPTKDLLVLIDGGGSLTSTRYVALEVPVGGFVDLIDTTTSSRASAASVSALGSPAQAAALTAVQASLSALTTAVGSPAQASDYSTARAALLDNLARLDALVSSRATPADLNVTVTAEPTFGGVLG